MPEEKKPFHTPYNNILPAKPLSSYPNYNPDLNERVEWENDRHPARPVKKNNGPNWGNNQGNNKPKK